MKYLVAEIISGVICWILGLFCFVTRIYSGSAEPMALGFVFFIVGTIFVLLGINWLRHGAGSKIEPASKKSESPNTALRFIGRVGFWIRWNFRMIFGFWPRGQLEFRESEAKVINARLLLIHENLRRNREDLNQEINDTSTQKDQRHIWFIWNKIQKLERLLDRASRIALEFDYPVDSDFFH